MKLPVLKAIGTVFAFVLQHWLDILRIVWLPHALMLGAALLIMPGYTRTIIDVASPGSSQEEAFAALAVAGPYFLGLMLAAVYVYLVVYAGLLKLVIRGEKPSLPFYLGFGADEMRLLGTFLLMFLIFIGAYLALILVGGIAGFIGSASAPAVAAIVIGVATIAWFVAQIWLALRLSLAAPAAIGAQKIGIGPSWDMTKGNAWRLFAYWLIWCLMFLVVEVIVVLITMPGYFEMVAFHSSGNSYEEMSRMAAQMYDFTSPLAILRLAFGFVFGIVLMVFLVITGGVAYRLMSDEEQVSQF